MASIYATLGNARCQSDPSSKTRPTFHLRLFAACHRGLHVARGARGRSAEECHWARRRAFAQTAREFGILIELAVTFQNTFSKAFLEN